MKDKVSNICRVIIGIQYLNSFTGNIVKSNTLQIINAKESVENELSSEFHLPLSGSHVDTKMGCNSSHEIAERDGEISK